MLENVWGLPRWIYSTGEFRATEFSGESALRRVQEELEQLRPERIVGYASAAPPVRGEEAAESFSVPTQGLTSSSYACSSTAAASGTGATVL